MNRSDDFERRVIRPATVRGVPGFIVGIYPKSDPTDLDNRDYLGGESGLGSWFSHFVHSLTKFATAPIYGITHPGHLLNNPVKTLKASDPLQQITLTRRNTNIIGPVALAFVPYVGPLLSGAAAAYYAQQAQNKAVADQAAQDQAAAAAGETQLTAAATAAQAALVAAAANPFSAAGGGGGGDGDDNGSNSVGFDTPAASGPSVVGLSTKAKLGLAAVIIGGVIYYKEKHSKKKSRGRR